MKLLGAIAAYCVVAQHPAARFSWRVAFVAVTHNNARTLPFSAQCVEALGAMLRDYRVFVYENDSTDGTQQALAAWARRNPRVQFASETLGRASAIADPQTRTQRLAEYRSRALAMVGDYACDAVVVWDTDLAWAPLRALGALRRLRDAPDCDFVAALPLARLSDGSTIFYDTFAYRDAAATRGVEDFRRAGESFELTWARFQAYRNVWLRAHLEALVAAPDDWRVRSAFGGFAVYRARAILGRRYEARGADCEHVPLHESTRGGLIDRAMVVLYN